MKLPYNESGYGLSRAIVWLLGLTVVLWWRHFTSPVTCNWAITSTKSGTICMQSRCFYHLATAFFLKGFTFEVGIHVVGGQHSACQQNWFYRLHFLCPKFSEERAKLLHYLIRTLSPETVIITNKLQAVIRWGLWTGSRMAPNHLPEVCLNGHIWQGVNPNHFCRSFCSWALLNFSQLGGVVWKHSWPWNWTVVIWTAASNSGLLLGQYIIGSTSVWGTQGEAHYWPANCSLYVAKFLAALVMLHDN